jgi:hypothetical protein
VLTEVYFRKSWKEIWKSEQLAPHVANQQTTAAAAATTTTTNRFSLNFIMGSFN